MQTKSKLTLIILHTLWCGTVLLIVPNVFGSIPQVPRWQNETIHPILLKSLLFNRHHLLLYLLFIYRSPSLSPSLSLSLSPSSPITDTHLLYCCYFSYSVGRWDGKCSPQDKSLWRMLKYQHHTGDISYIDIDRGWEGVCVCERDKEREPDKKGREERRGTVRGREREREKRKEKWWDCSVMWCYVVLRNALWFEYELVLYGIEFYSIKDNSTRNSIYTHLSEMSPCVTYYAVKRFIPNCKTQ